MPMFRAIPQSSKCRPPAKSGTPGKVLRNGAHSLQSSHTFCPASVQYSHCLKRWKPPRKQLRKRAEAENKNGPPESAGHENSLLYYDRLLTLRCSTRAFARCRARPCQAHGLRRRSSSVVDGKRPGNRSCRAGTELNPQRATAVGQNARPALWTSARHRYEVAARHHAVDRNRRAHIVDHGDHADRAGRTHRH